MALASQRNATLASGWKHVAHGSVNHPRVHQHRWSVRAGSSSAAFWPSATDKMVALSSIPFTVLSLPQAIQNFQNIANGNEASLQAVSWLAYATALIGNTLMCGHFTSRGESSAVGVQVIGIANNLLILAQLAFVGAMPAAAFAGIVFVVVLSLLVMKIHAAKVAASHSSNNGSQAAAKTPYKLPPWSIFQTWQLAAGCLGLAAVPQTLWSTFFPQQATVLPGAVALAAAYTFFSRKLQSKPPSEAAIEVATLPGWGATLMFALSPLPQLVRNFMQPSSLEGLSLGTMLLALLGNALMVPRALHTRDVVWFAGSTWACTAGWGQLLSMALGVSAATGSPYLPLPVFAGLTAALALHLSLATMLEARFRGLASPLQAVAAVLSPA